MVQPRFARDAVPPEGLPQSGGVPGLHVPVVETVDEEDPGLDPPSVGQVVPLAPEGAVVARHPALPGGEPVQDGFADLPVGTAVDGRVVL